MNAAYILYKQRFGIKIPPSYSPFRWRTERDELANKLSTEKERRKEAEAKMTAQRRALESQTRRVQELCEGLSQSDVEREHLAAVVNQHSTLEEELRRLWLHKCVLGMIFALCWRQGSHVRWRAWELEVIGRGIFCVWFLFVFFGFEVNACILYAFRSV